MLQVWSRQKGMPWSINSDLHLGTQSPIEVLRASRHRFSTPDDSSSPRIHIAPSPLPPEKPITAAATHQPSPPPPEPSEPARPPSLPPASPMTNFELEPRRFLPVGHGIID